MDYAIPEFYTIIIKKSIQNLFYTFRKNTVIGGKELLYAAKAVGAKTYSVTYPLPGRGGDVPGPGHYPDLAPG